MPAERRRHERLRIRAEARVVLDGRETRYSARDLSLGGAFLAAGPESAALDAGRTLELSLCPDEDAPHHAVIDGTTFHAAARVVRTDGSGIGIRFERMDIESETRLRAWLDVEGD
jgi:PilZ domain